MDQPITIGLDLAKSVLQVHGVSGDGSVVLRRQLRRSQVLAFFERLSPCLVGMEACSGAHHWARELGALGHEVRLMVRGDRGPSGAAKAPGTTLRRSAKRSPARRCASRRRRASGTTPVKTAERQAAPLGHVAPKVRLRRNARDFLVRQRTQTVNAIRAHLAEFGIVVAKGIHNLDRLIAAAQDVPEAARPALDVLAGQLRDLKERIEAATMRITAAQKVDPIARRLAAVPGLGPIASSAFAATTPDVGVFRSACDYAASCRRHASGVTARISARRGRRAAPEGSAPDWLDRMLARKPVKVVAIALAARMARTVWALIAHGDSDRATALAERRRDCCRTRPAPPGWSGASRQRRAFGTT